MDKKGQRTEMGTSGWGAMASASHGEHSGTRAGRLTGNRTGLDRQVKLRAGGAAQACGERNSRPVGGGEGSLLGTQRAESVGRRLGGALVWRENGVSMICDDGRSCQAHEEFAPSVRA